MKVDIDVMVPEIVKLLKPLKPDRIILFGSYAYGTPHEDSDIDLFLLKDDLPIDELDAYELQARKNIRTLIAKYRVGFDILSAPTSYIEGRDDYFYKIEILRNGRVLYEQNSGT
ncbi:MAG: nucleotidyltransferase domain-containing protein [Deltaproteobacteria bacterium]|nr:nucleotidyltransferase domain-containing protein [Candidatus Anaeroferrophillacea bacterium]